MCDALHAFGVGTTVDVAVLLPGFPHQQSHSVKVAPLYGVIHVKSVLTHHAQLCQFFILVEEHPSHDFCQNILGRTSDACII